LKSGDLRALEEILDTLQVRQRKVDPTPSYRQVSNPRVFLVTFPALRSRVVWVDDLARRGATNWTLNPWCRPLPDCKSHGFFQQPEHWALQRHCSPAPLPGEHTEDSKEGVN